MTHAEIEQRNTLIRQDFINGMIKPEIRKKYNANNGIIGYAVRGLKRKRTDYTGARKFNLDEIIKLHREGLNHFQTAEKLNASPRYIYDLLKSKGIKPYKIKRAKRTKGIYERPKFIREELPPRLEAIRQRYKDMPIVTESNQAMRIREDDIPVTVKPTSYKRNYSQVIFR